MLSYITGHPTPSIGLTGHVLNSGHGQRTVSFLIVAEAQWTVWRLCRLDAVMDCNVCNFQTTFALDNVVTHDPFHHL
jgi:hypothetical protein